MTTAVVTLSDGSSAKVLACSLARWDALHCSALVVVVVLLLLLLLC
jgi:hypothetical protein